MDHIGIDVHKVHRQISILTEDGELIERGVRTGAEHLAGVLGPRSRAQIVIESATESEWVARCLEALSHEVIVADPNAPMYAQRRRNVKTDVSGEPRGPTGLFTLAATRRLAESGAEQP